MSASTVITGGFGTFGTISLVITDGYSQAAVIAVAAPQPSGGWPIRARRYPSDEERKRQRIELGILPEEIISQVAHRQVEDLHLDEQQRFEELTRELQLREIEFDSRYLEALNIQREALIDEEIGRLLKKAAEQKRLDNQNELALIILLAAIA